MNWLPYQQRFLKAVANPAFLTCALSIPRGGGKSTMAGWLAARALVPGDPLYRTGNESILASGSIEQCRIVFRQALKFLEAKGLLDQYRIIDSATRVAIMHKPTRTRLRALGSNPKTSLGLVDCPLVILDEPAALNEVGGLALWDSLVTAQGKAGSALKLLAIGTLAPAKDGNWWPKLVKQGTAGSRYVQHLQGRLEKWDKLSEALRVNPLAKFFPAMKAKIKEELAEAKSDSRLKARYLSFRLNLPSADEQSMLLSVEDWQVALARPVEIASGNPVLGIDLGANRAWSAAVAIWPTGRVEAIAYAAGIPAIEEQERRDRVPAGTYSKLVDGGQLLVADGLHKPEPKHLLGEAIYRFGQPSRIVCDFFQIDDLRNAAGGLVNRIVPRRTRWSESTADIKALHSLVRDGGLSVDAASRALLTASLAAAETKHDDGGSVRLIKRGFNNTSRDDVAAALVLAAGELKRQLDAPRRAATWTYA